MMYIAPYPIAMRYAVATVSKVGVKVISGFGEEQCALYERV
jgi:hypothetical protein